MRTSGQWVLVCLSSILAVSCAVPGLTPVTNPAQRLEFHGFSILPPQGNNWHFIKKDSHGVNFGKKLVERPTRPAERGHTFIAVARADYVKKTEIKTPWNLRQFVELNLIWGWTDRFKLVESKVVSISSLGSVQPQIRFSSTKPSN